MAMERELSNELIPDRYAHCLWMYPRTSVQCTSYGSLVVQKPAKKYITMTFLLPKLTPVNYKCGVLHYPVQNNKDNIPTSYYDFVYCLPKMTPVSFHSTEVFEKPCEPTRVWWSKVKCYPATGDKEDDKGFATKHSISIQFLPREY